MKPAIVTATPGYWCKSETGAYRRVVAWEIDYHIDDHDDPDPIIMAGKAYPIVISDVYASSVVFNNTGSPM